MASPVGCRSHNMHASRQAISSTRQRAELLRTRQEMTLRGAKESLHGRVLQEMVNARLMGRGSIRTLKKRMPRDQSKAQLSSQPPVSDFHDRCDMFV